MPEEPAEYGQIDISPAAVASIVSQAVLQCYGVVGMAGKGFVNGIAHLLSRDNSRKGINVTIDDNGIVIDVFVIVQYGVRIRTVAESIQNTVSYHVAKALDQPVTAVNVYVQGLRIDDQQD